MAAGLTRAISRFAGSALRGARLRRSRPAGPGPSAWVAVVLCLAAVCPAVLAGCGGGQAEPESTPKPGGTLAYPLDGEPLSIEPLNAQDASGLQVAHQVFQGLTRWVMDDHGTLVTKPCIAESWESSDAQTWTFHLRAGVTFQAPVSRPVTAQDFVDSWTRVTDPENASYVAYILAALEGCDDRGYQTDPAQGLTGVKALDDRTLQVRLRYPFADFPAVLGHPVAAVTPVDYVERVGAKKFAAKPVGTGPYAVVSWKHDRELRLARNTAYWDASEPGWVDAIELPIFSDAETMWDEFGKGLLDCSQVPAGQARAAGSDARVQSGEWSARSWPALAVAFVGINMADTTLGQDPELRQAVAESTDAQAVIAGVGEDVPSPASGYVPPGVPGYKDGLDPYPKDVDAAAAVVAKLGDVPGLAYWYDEDVMQEKIARTLASGWSRAGLTVEPAGYEWGAFLDKLAAGGRGGGSQLFRMGWIADYPAMDAFLYPLFQSDQSRTGSYTFYVNPGVDDVLRQARATMDAQQRQNLYAQAEKLVLADMPAVPLYYYRYLRVSRARIGGFTVDPMGFTDMWRVWVR